jgi:hypothetical protein
MENQVEITLLMKIIIIAAKTTFPEKPRYLKFLLLASML